MISYIVESRIEQATLDILGNMGYETLFGLDITSNRRTPESEFYKDVVLTEGPARLIDRLNPSIITIITGSRNYQ
jgi:hypothetical protein